MEKILKYLKQNGVLRISNASVEKYYREFSCEEYDASWASVTDELIEEFAEWLEKKEI